MKKLIIYTKGLILIELNGKWYIPSRIQKLEPHTRVLRIDCSPKVYPSDFHKENSKYVEPKIIEDSVIWDINFGIPFAYIPEVGIMGIV